MIFAQVIKDFRSRNCLLNPEFFRILVERDERDKKQFYWLCSSLALLLVTVLIFQAIGHMKHRNFWLFFFAYEKKQEYLTRIKEQKMSFTSVPYACLSKSSRYNLQYGICRLICGKQKRMTLLYITCKVLIIIITLLENNEDIIY